jgi:hypothetical protein
MQTRNKANVKIKNEDSMEVSRVNWTDDKIKRGFIETMLKFVRNGKQTTDNGFKSQEWKQIRDEFNKILNVNYSRSQLHNQYSELKKYYSKFKALKDNSGFGYILLSNK